MSENIRKVKKTNLVDNGKSFRAELEDGSIVFFSTNLIKHLLEVPYMKADGTPVTTEQIREQKRNSSKRYYEEKMRKSF